MREATTVPQRGRRKYDDDDDDKETDVEQRGGQPAAVIGRLQVGNNLDLEENFERRDVQLHSLLTRDLIIKSLLSGDAGAGWRSPPTASSHWRLPVKEKKEVITLSRRSSGGGWRSDG